jgi:hypothetical protein
MPNWSVNSVRIYATKETLDIIESGARNGKLLQTLAPLPPHDLSDRYNTQVSTWGTKWEVDQTEIFREDTDIILDFNTAWNPPLQALMGAVKRFKDISLLEMRYVELGCGFCGDVVYEGGHFSHASHDLPSTQKELDELLDKLQSEELKTWLAETYYFDEDEGE